jgi:hypothetical protein
VDVPRVVQLCLADVPSTDWQWIGPVPVTTHARTLRACIKYHVQPDIVEQAFEDAVKHGLVSRKEAKALKRLAAYETAS